MQAESLATLASALRAQPSWARKRDIESVSRTLAWNAGGSGDGSVRLGDDAAALPDGDGYRLLASELVYPRLVREDPYMAGRVAVLSNVNDIFAMGGRPIALVDTILATSERTAIEVLRGLRDGCARYGLSVVGGHLTTAAEADSVSAAILGRATRLLTSFDARPGDLVLQVANFRGQAHPSFPFWNCSGHLSDEALRADLEILPRIAEAGWCRAARDVSMAGLLGSLLMLLELSEVGARVDVDAIDRPAPFGRRLRDWLCAVPSYGFVLAAPPRYQAAIRRAFAQRDIACSIIGEVTARRCVELCHAEESILLWDFAREAFTGLASVCERKEGVA